MLGWNHEISKKQIVRKTLSERKNLLTVKRTFKLLDLSFDARKFRFL